MQIESVLWTCHYRLSVCLLSSIVEPIWTRHGAMVHRTWGSAVSILLKNTPSDPVIARTTVCVVSVLTGSISTFATLFYSFTNSSFLVLTFAKTHDAQYSFLRTIAYFHRESAKSQMQILIINCTQCKKRLFMDILYLLESCWFNNHSDICWPSHLEMSTVCPATRIILHVRNLGNRRVISLFTLWSVWSGPRFASIQHNHKGVSE